MADGGSANERRVCACLPRSPDALNYHGEFLVESGALEGARSKFTKAIEVSGGGCALAHVNLGVLKLHGENDLEGAIERCKVHAHARVHARCPEPDPGPDSDSWPVQPVARPVGLLAPV